MEACVVVLMQDIFGETRTGWLEKYSTYNPKTDWLKAPFTDVISETYPKYYAVLQHEDAPVALH